MKVDPTSAVLLSLEVGVASTLLTLGPALAIAWILARGRFRGKAVLTGIVTAPLVLPPVVTGLLLLRAFGRGTLLGGALQAIGLPVVFSWTGAVLAAAIVGFPLYVLTIRQAFEAIDPRYEEVSLTLGAPPVATFRRITLPLALPGIAAATVLAFARGLGEFGATAVVAGNVEGRTRTIALAIYALLDSPAGDAQIRTLLVASLALAFGALAAFELLVGRQRRRLDLDGG